MKNWSSSVRKIEQFHKAIAAKLTIKKLKTRGSQPMKKMGIKSMSQRGSQPRCMSPRPKTPSKPRWFRTKKTLQPSARKANTPTAPLTRKS